MKRGLEGGQERRRDGNMGMPSFNRMKNHTSLFFFCLSAHWEIHLIFTLNGKVDEIFSPIILNVCFSCIFCAHLHLFLDPHFYIVFIAYYSVWIFFYVGFELCLRFKECLKSFVA